jgi:hypothetical protein
MFRATLIAFLALLLACCSNGPRAHFATLTDAKASDFFSHGWLPDVLPISARNIDVVTDLDLNEASGQFDFDPADFPSLNGELSALTSTNETFPESINEEITHQLKSGLPVFLHAEDRSKWVFLCAPSKGHCRFTMWLDRK